MTNRIVNEQSYVFSSHRRSGANEADERREAAEPGEKVVSFQKYHAASGGGGPDRRAAQERGNATRGLPDFKN